MVEKTEFDEITSISLLYDYYGNLLPERQRQVIHLYYEENLSLAEIGQEFGISRQGVHDALKKAQKALDEYESQLGLIQRFSETTEAIRMIDEQLQSIMQENKANTVLTEQLSKIKDIIDNIDY